MLATGEAPSQVRNLPDHLLITVHKIAYDAGGQAAYLQDAQTSAIAHE